MAKNEEEVLWLHIRDVCKEIGVGNKDMEQWWFYIHTGSDATHIHRCRCCTYTQVQVLCLHVRKSEGISQQGQTYCRDWPQEGEQ